MTTWTVMITVTKDQWLALHRRTLDCVRYAIRDLPKEKLLWIPQTTGGEAKLAACDIPRPFCIGGVVAHLGEVEMQRLGEVGVRANFAAPRLSDWNQQTFEAILDRMEEQYRAVLEKWPKDRRVVFGLGRVCQHNLYHLAHLAYLRSLFDPDWQPPPPGQAGAWEHAADYITDLLILGDKATNTASQT
jgi:hypothetical protein